MLEDMAARKLTPHTQRSHISSCERFAAWLTRSPVQSPCLSIDPLVLAFARSLMPPVPPRAATRSLCSEQSNDHREYFELFGA
jgi:hypothetical protein